MSAGERTVGLALPLTVRELACTDHRGMGYVIDANGLELAYGDMALSMEKNRAIAKTIVQCVNAYDSLLSEREALTKRVAELEPAAECWNAIAACYRITCMGSAGLIEPMETCYAHITVNLWTCKGPGPERATGDAQDLHGRNRLAQFMKIAIGNLAKPVKP